MEDTISRKMAIDALIACKGKDPFNRYEKQNIGLDWGIEALKQLPSAHPEKRTEERTETHGVCLDAIDRQEAIDVLYKNHILGRGDLDEVLDHIVERLDKLPSAQPEQRLSCKNCIHLGHGYMMPCKNCKRNQMLPDWYEV